MKGLLLICQLTPPTPPSASCHLLRVVFIFWYLLKRIFVFRPVLLLPVARLS